MEPVLDERVGGVQFSEEVGGCDLDGVGPLQNSKI